MKVFSIASSVKLTFPKVLFKVFRSDLIKYDLFKVELQSINMVFAAFVLFFFLIYLRPYASDGAMRTDDDDFFI